MSQGTHGPVGESGDGTGACHAPPRVGGVWCAQLLSESDPLLSWETTQGVDALSPLQIHRAVLAHILSADKTNSQLWNLISPTLFGKMC